MRGIATSLSDQDIADLAAYYEHRVQQAARIQRQVIQPGVLPKP